MRAISIVAAALVLAAPAAAHSLTATQTHVLKHRFQLSTYKIRWYENHRWILRPKVDTCRQLRARRAQGRCFKHREGLRWHRDRVERISRLLWPPQAAVTPVATVGVALCGASCVQCESGGDPSARSADGRYWGLYQFDYGTWVAHGGNPASYGHAGAAEQTAVAARVRYRAWPVCGSA